MSRRLERSIWSNEHKRRSARISAQEDKTTNSTSAFEEGSSRVKRKYQEEGIENQNWKENSSTDDQKMITETKEKEMLDNGSPLLPDKHLLELVLDVLQRRDTHEIFAEPVDPQEVEGYYEIVKEPMDFGTMRAKLHEGMYNTLEEFEHDAFLIPKNALLFNSTGSIFFRQARAIDDLAKKVFNVLKTNPKKLESEFSGTRRRSSRRLQEGKGLKLNPHSETAKNVTDNIISSNGAQNFENTHSDLKKSIEDNSLFSRKVPFIGARGSEFSTGVKDGKRLDGVEVDRRSTYIPPMPFDWGNGSIVSTMDGGPQMLTRVNQSAISYSESLMKFTKGLGPVAQMIAKRKIQACINLHRNPEKTLQAPIDLNNFDDKNNSHINYENCMKSNISTNSSGYEVFKSDINQTNGVERLNLSSMKLNGDSSKPSEKVENPGIRIGLKSNFRRGFSNLRPTDDVETSSAAPSTSPFAFNLSFLKSKLNQMEK